MRKYNLLVFLVILTNISFASDKIPVGKSCLLNYDASSEAMGNTIASFSNNSFSFFNSPSANFNVLTGRVDFSAISVFDGTYIGAGAFMLPSSIGNFTIAGAYNYFQSSNTYIINDKYLTNNSAFYFNYVLPFIKSIPVYDNLGGMGVTLKGYRFDTERASKIAFAADFGVHVKLKFISNDLWTVASYKNFGDKIEIAKSQEFELAKNIDCALRYNFKGASKVSIAVDVLQFLADNSFGYSIGAEVCPISAANLRVGWRDYNDGIFKGITAGLFINFPSFNIGYTFAGMDKDYHSKHTVNLGFMFGWISDEYKASNYYLGTKFNEAEEFYHRKDFVTARRCFEDILDIYPDHLPSKKYLRKIAVVLNNNDKFIYISISELLNKADLEFHRNNLIKSMHYYNEVLNLDPNNPVAAKGISAVKVKLTKIEAQKNRKKYAKQIIALWNEAMELYNEENFIFAKEKFEQITAIDPENAGALKYLDIIKVKVDKIATAQIDNIFKQGMQYYNLQDYNNAAKHFNAVYIADPKRIDAKDFYDRAIKANKSITEKSKTGTGLK